MLVYSHVHLIVFPNPHECDDSKFLKKAKELVSRQAIQFLKINAPSWLHADHELTGQLGRAASFVYAATNTSTRPLISGATVPHYYTDGNRGCDRVGIPVEPTTVDISGQLDRKTEILACHVTQYEWLRRCSGIDEYLSAMQAYCQARSGMRCLSCEVFVQPRGNAQWSQSCEP